jgi:hypothetical protein
MQSIRIDGDPLASVFGLDNAGYYLWLSPLLGAIFAVILTSIFIAGFVKGSLLPEFYLSSGGSEQGLPFFHFTWNTLPKTSEDYAKLFVWAFLAGFAERLVPDSLDRLASKLEPAEKPLPPAPTPAVPAGNGPQVPPPPNELEAKPKITTETIQDVLHTGESPKDPTGNNPAQDQGPQSSAPRYE